MHIKRLKVQNIGPYIGEVDFEFETTSEKKITLIGGMNGSGKTTLLNSIRVALFGAYSFGYKSDSSSYKENIYKLLNYRVLETKSPIFSLDITFILDEEYVKNEYRIVREWKLKSKNDEERSIEEKHYSFKNNIRLGDIEDEDLISKLKEIYPPKLIDMSFFDGEKIGSIIEEGKVAEYIKDLFYTNFGLNYFDKLNEDLDYYHNNEIESNDKTELELRFEEYERDYKRLQLEKAELLSSIQDTEKNVKGFENEIKTEKKKYQNYGGLSSQEKSQISKRANEDFAKLKKSREELGNFFELNYFFVTHRNTLKECIYQYKLEKPQVYINQLLEIKDFFDKQSTTNKIDISNLLDTLHNLTGKNTFSIFRTDDKDIEIRLIEKTEEVDEIDIVKVSEILNVYFSEKSKNTAELKQLETNELSLGLLNLLKNINSIESDLAQNRTLLNSKKETLNSIQKRLENYAIEIDKINIEIRKGNNQDNSFLVAINTIQAINEFTKIYQSKIVAEISKKTLEKFCQLSPKSNYIKQINISDSFQMTFIDMKNKQMPIDILSAGEKQLMIASLVYSIIKTSNRNTLFVFDTPLARLDTVNRGTFVEKIIKDISNQILVLSTNSEIVGTTKKILDGNIVRTYLLDYRNKLNQTFVSESYFEEE